MNEITRIHIAKYPYDIEIEAKKQLESYIRKLEMYSDDENLLEDIEIRMTEILAERNVEKNGLISVSDIDALKEQLGEPKEFWGEGDIALGSTQDDEDRPRRRLYRDLQGAALGGVLSGIAKYLDISPVWTRIIFLIIATLTFGTALIVYAILWIIIPPARTAAEKLESAGKAVTLASIKSLNEGEVAENRLAPAIRGLLRMSAGIFLILLAVGALVATGLGIYEFSSYLWWFNPNGMIYAVPSTWYDWLAVGLLTAAGLLLASLLILQATAIFKKKWVKRTTIATIAIIISGVLTFGGGAGILIYKAWEQSVTMNNSRTVENALLPSGFKAVESLLMDGVIANGKAGTIPVNIHYVVSTGAPRYEMVSGNQQIKPIIKLDGTSATVTMSAENDVSNFYVLPTLTIYGPALNHLTVKSGAFDYYNQVHQDSISVATLSHHIGDQESGIIDMSGSFTLKGSYGMVTATADQSSAINLDQATIEELNANLTIGYITAGVVRTLHANLADVCPSSNTGVNASNNRIVVDNISSKLVTLNGKEQKAETTSNACGVLIIGSEQEYDQQDY